MYKEFLYLFTTYSKFLPVVAGYRRDRRNFFELSMMKTALQVSGTPSLFNSSLSNIFSFNANSRLSSAIIG